MRIHLADEATDYGRAARRAFEAAGGDELARSADADPGRRAALVAPVLAELGAWELHPRADADEAEATAALCRSAGYWALPYPVAERLARPQDLAADGLIAVGTGPALGPIAGLDGDWVAVTLDGQRHRAVASADTTPGAAAGVSAFVTALDLEPIDDDGGNDAALVLVLQCWTLLGMLDRALELTRDYVAVRHQFGQPLSRFQGVRFQVADAEVERSGLDMLAKYALWSVQDARPEALDDALALRMAALEAAEIVLRTAHQLHGAIGFCDETSLSWVSRASLPLRQLPLGLSATRDTLTRRLGHHGLAGLFAAPD